MQIQNLKERGLGSVCGEVGAIKLGGKVIYREWLQENSTETIKS